MVETELWRILSRDIELSRSIAGVAAILAHELPVVGVVVFYLDLGTHRPEVVGTDWLRPPRQPVPPHGQWTAEQLELLLTWHRQGKARRGRPVGDPLLQALWPIVEPVDVIGVPVHAGGDELGVLLLVGGGTPFAAVHEELATRLGEPFCAALRNDRRLRELERAQKTLEADRRSLLERLDRDNIVEQIVGSDAGLSKVMAKVEQVAPTDVPVLLFGETGSGKEVVARAVHAQSRRRSGPMVRVNCGAIPPGLVDSDLFGHERGGFTGAVANRLGWFERADGGTLFLDEVGELPGEAQVRLLRVLQEGTIERVGGMRSIHVDVRVVAATHRDLGEMVSRGTFREDLWYRLSVFPIALPPLRERRHDIPLLAAHFAARVGRRLGGGHLSLSRDEIELLLAYDWPGNVRELAAVIERAAILGNGTHLVIRDALGAGSGARPASPRNGARPFPPLAQAMRAHIEEALQHSAGRIEGATGAAHLLQINPHTLRARMRKLGVTWAQYRPR